MHPFFKSPSVIGGLGGAALGGGIGYAASNKDDKLRGAITGAGMGGYLGAIGAQSYMTGKKFTENFQRDFHRRYNSGSSGRTAGFAGWSFKPSSTNLKNIGATGKEKTKEEIRKKYKDIAFKNHPDRGGSTKKMQEINSSWDEIRRSRWFEKLSHPIFWESFEKQASAFAHGAELAGLGLLAKPSYDALKGKNWSEKNKNRAEVAGLGILAAPSAAAAAKGAAKHAPEVLSKAKNFLADSYLKARLMGSFRK